MAVCSWFLVGCRRTPRAAGMPWGMDGVLCSQGALGRRGAREEPCGSLRPRGGIALASCPVVGRSSRLTGTVVAAGPGGARHGNGRVLGREFWAKWREGGDQRVNPPPGRCEFSAALSFAARGGDYRHTGEKAAGWEKKRPGE